MNVNKLQGTKILITIIHEPRLWFWRKIQIFRLYVNTL